MVKSLSDNLVLDFNDTEGKHYIFHKKNYLKHLPRHADMREKGYFEKVKELIINCQPELIYPAYNTNNTYVYYNLIAQTPQGDWYNQAVVMIKNNTYIILTAYRFRGVIREKKYGGPVCQRP